MNTIRRRHTKEDRFNLLSRAVGMKRKGMTWGRIATEINVPEGTLHGWRKENPIGEDNQSNVEIELSSDFWNWMAGEIISLRQENTELKSKIKQLEETVDKAHKIIVSNELAIVYQEYTRR